MKEEWKFQDDSLDAESGSIGQSSSSQAPLKRDLPSSINISSSTKKHKPSTDEDLNCLLKFFLENDVPLSAINSHNLRKFLEKLKPGYLNSLPDEETFKTIILDNLYQTVLDEVLSKKAQNFTLILSHNLHEKN